MGKKRATATQDEEQVVQEAQVLARQPMETGSILAVIKDAVVNKADVAVIRELLAIRREEEANEARKAYAEAIVHFRSRCPTIKRTGRANFGTGKASYTYAQLPDAMEQIQDLLKECGLAVTWTTPQQTPEWIQVSCTVTHVFGHSETTTLAGKPDAGGGKNALHAIKSTWTYLRRVTLFSLLGLVDKDEIDDDGAGGAPGTDEPPKPEAQRDIEAGALAAKQQFVALCRAKAEWPDMPMDKVKKVYEAVAEIVGDDPQDCFDYLHRDDLLVAKDGTITVLTDNTEPPAEEIPLEPPPVKFVCRRCKQEYIVRPANGKCTCLGEVREIEVGKI